MEISSLGSSFHCRGEKSSLGLGLGLLTAHESLGFSTIWREKKKQKTKLKPKPKINPTVSLVYFVIWSIFILSL